jgi:hypothetical protein
LHFRGAVGVGFGTAVSVLVGRGVEVAVGTGVSVGTGVEVCVAVAVDVGVSVGSGVEVGSGVGVAGGFINPQPRVKETMVMMKRARYKFAG